MVVVSNYTLGNLTDTNSWCSGLL